MGKHLKKTTVEGGWVKRDTSTGKFVEVHTSKGTTRASKQSETSLKEASSKRTAALKRLANR